MRTPLALANITHNKARSLTAIGGVSFAILLVFLELGIYGSCVTSSTRTHDLLDFDLAIVSPHYATLRRPHRFPRARLQQAAAVPGIASLTGLHIGSANWRNPGTGYAHDMLVIGVEPASLPFTLDELNRGLSQLTRDDVALVDRVAHVLTGPHAPGTVAELGGRRMRVVGAYTWGTGLTSLATAVVGESAFAAIVPGGGARMTQLGLVKLSPGARVEEVQARLRAGLPEDVRVRSRREAMAAERSYWMNVKPIGIMFTSGVVIGFLVGTVILYQVLSSDLTNHLREYATLKAIGYRERHLRGVVLQQGLLIALLAFVPAAAVATVLYALLTRAASLPVEMTAGRLATVLLLSVAMCALSGLLAVRRVTTADPADLF